MVLVALRSQKQLGAVGTGVPRAIHRHNILRAVELVLEQWQVKQRSACKDHVMFSFPIRCQVFKMQVELPAKASFI